MTDLVPATDSPNSLAEVERFTAKIRAFVETETDPEIILGSYAEATDFENVVGRLYPENVAAVRRELHGYRRLVGEVVGPRQKGGRGKNRQDLDGLHREHIRQCRLMHEWWADGRIAAMVERGDAIDAIIKRIRKAKTQDSETAARLISVETVQADAEGDGWQMFHGDFRERLEAIPDGSVDMIVTDPPYPAEFLPLWSDLSKHAARVLAPQGILVALSGKIMLLDVMNRLAEHLNYGWMYHQMLPGSNSRILARQTLQTQKPWLAFSNGTWPSGRIEWHEDTLTEAFRSKTRFRWEQQTGPAAQLIDTLCTQGGTALDPFAGSGSYGVSAMSVGRRFIGVEHDEDRFAQCVERLTDATT